MALVDELDVTIRTADKDVGSLEQQVEHLRRQIALRRQVMFDALRLYRSATGSPHPLEGFQETDNRERPRAEQVLAVMEAAGRAVTLAELVSAMPDKPERGAISAVVHRAIQRGEVRRLRRGVYELAGRYARAS